MRKRTAVVSACFAKQAGHKGTKAARAQFDAWLRIAESSTWRTPEDVKKAHPGAGILKAGRAVFNIKGNDLRLIVLVQYRAGVISIRFVGTRQECDRIDAKKV